MIESRLLNQIPGIEHGFGTRDDDFSDTWHAKQIHSDQIISLTEEGALVPSGTIEADAIITRRCGQAIGIQTADCVPILIVSPETEMIAAVHAGWRGTAASIVSKVVDELVGEGCSRPDIHVAIGPCISEKNYEVGDEVGKLFGGVSHLDLLATNRQQLIDAGVLPEHIDLIELCTFDRADLFYSYRRDGNGTGRNISWIKLLPQR